MKRTWRAATAGVAAATLLTLSAGSAVAQLDDLEDAIGDLIGEGDDDEDENGNGDAAATELGPGGFVGCAGATGLQVRVGLPEELAELNQLLEPLGLSSPTGAFGNLCETDFSDDGFGIYLDLARTQAELARAAAGEDPTPLAEALATNLVLENAPCTGLGSAALPDEDAPVLRIDLADVSCEESGDQALANAKVAGVYLNAGTLFDLFEGEGFPDAFREGFGEFLDTINSDVLASINEELIGTVCEGALADGLKLVSPDPGEGCEALELELANFLDAEIPLIELDVLDSTSEVTFDGDTVTAQASAELAGLSLLGLVCAEGTDPGTPLAYSSTATSDGIVATATAESTDVTARLCGNPALLRILDFDGLLGSIEIGDQRLSEAFPEQFEELRDSFNDGLNDLLATFGTQVAAERDADIEQVNGAAALASTPPFVIANVAPFSVLPGFEDTPLADVSVSVAGLETFAAVNAEPDAEPITPPGPPPEEPEEPEAPARRLPRTGAGAGLAALAALGAAYALRRNG